MGHLDRLEDVDKPKEDDDEGHQDPAEVLHFDPRHHAERVSPASTRNILDYFSL